jgi:hypothetical protein
MIMASTSAMAIFQQLARQRPWAADILEGDVFAVVGFFDRSLQT